MEIYSKDGTLYHHGIKGQQWGKRRYQNQDGSLTPAGEARYYNADGSLTKAGRYARDSRLLSYDVRKSHLQKLHESKKKEPDDPDINYHLDQKIRGGKKYVKKLAKQLRDGYITSFTEDSKGQIKGPGVKTKKGVVIRDKDGNRITTAEYHAAQRYISRYGNRRIDTGRYQ